MKAWPETEAEWALLVVLLSSGSKPGFVPSLSSRFVQKMGTLVNMEYNVDLR